MGKWYMMYREGHGRTRAVSNKMWPSTLKETFFLVGRLGKKCNEEAAGETSWCFVHISSSAAILFTNKP